MEGESCFLLHMLNRNRVGKVDAAWAGEGQTKEKVWRTDEGEASSALLKLYLSHLAKFLLSCTFWHSWPGWDLGFCIPSKLSASAAGLWTTLWEVSVQVTEAKMCVERTQGPGNQWECPWKILLQQIMSVSHYSRESQQPISLNF